MNQRSKALKRKGRSSLKQAFELDKQHNRLVRNTQFGRGRYNSVAVPLNEVRSIIDSCFAAQDVNSDKFTNGDAAMICYGWSRNKHPRGAAKVGVVVGFMHEAGFAHGTYPRMSRLKDTATPQKIMRAVMKLPAT